MSLQVIGAIERGHYVARVPGRGVMAIVPLGPLGRRIGGVEVGAICANLGTTEIGGRFWRRMKRKVKKAVKKTISVAKVIANNKVIKNLYQTARAFAPSPLNQVLGAIETGVRVGKAIAGGSKKVKAALPVIKKLAAGKTTLRAAGQAAKKLGVKPETVRDAAAMIKLKAVSRRDPKIASAFRAASEIERSVSTPKSIERIVTAPRSGRKYAVMIRPAA